MQQLLLLAALAVGALVGVFLLTGAPTIGDGPAMEASMIHDTSDIEVPGTCQGEETRQFDFWVGEWDLNWEGGQGSNVIRSVLGGCVIEENFADTTSQFYGKSVSTYSPQLGKWRQTWVDNSGAYLDFVGGMEADRMILSRQFSNAEGQTVMQRMQWYNITKDSLDWNWERSLDEGQSWEVLWKIRYERSQ